MKPKFLLFLSVLTIFISCKNEQKELTKLSQEEVYDMIVNRHNLNAENAVYKNEDGKIISFDSVKKLKYETTSDYYINDRNEIVEIVVRKALEGDKNFERELKSGKDRPVLSVTIDCEKVPEILQSVHDADQKMRQTGDLDSEKDFENLSTVINLIEQCGMPTLKEVNSEQMTAIWLVFQHSDNEYRKRYFPLLRKAAANGDLKETQIAMMQDRILMSEGKPQIYGTQVTKANGTDAWMLYDLRNPETVDKRRERLGWEPLKDYLANWDIEFTTKQIK
jgi:hypothetical protein